MKITFVVPTYGQTALVATCLTSLRQYHTENEIIVVDDGSIKEIQDALAPICKKHKAKLLTSFWNNGFGHTCNRGLDSSDADIVILINNDVVLTSNITTELESIFEKDTKIGIVGSLLYYPDGKIQHGGHVRIGKYTFGHYDHGKTANMAKEAYFSKYNIGVTGALMALRKSMINKIGGFKVGYKLAYEDTEICLRAWHNDYRVYYTSNINAIHYEGYTRGVSKKQKKELGFLDQEQESEKQFHKDLVMYDLEKFENKIANLNGLITDIKKPKTKIGIHRNGAMGDCILTTGIIELLKIRNPHSEIYVSSAMQYPYRNNPNIHEIVNKPGLIAKKCDIFYNLDMVYEITPDIHVLNAYANHVFGKNNYNNNQILPKLYNAVCDRMDLLCKIKNSFIPLGGKCVVIHPTSSWMSRTINKKTWDHVIDWLLEQNYIVINIGQHGDITPTIKKNVYDLKNKLTLPEIRELIKLSKLFVGIDSGLLHIAQTTETPIVGIFSVARPEYRVFRKYNFASVEPNSECKYCLEKIKPPVTYIECAKKTNECINSISSDDIIKAIIKLKGEAHV